MSDASQHHPVMRDRVIALLAPSLTEPGAVLVDATVGLGGHSAHALGLLPQLRVVGLDRDPTALELARESLRQYSPRLTLVHAVYDELPAVLSSLGLEFVHGILFDLGVSSMQLDVRERGFAYSTDAPLDMRMDPGTPLTAAQVLNTYPASELTRILREYGEERFATRIARSIVREREKEPFTTSARLVELIRAAIPAPARRVGGHPAKRTFQALRIEVNGELAALERALPAALDALTLGGRLVVMSYQSLEDRIVKSVFADRSTSAAPVGLPVVPDALQPRFRLVVRGALVPDEAEVAANPRAASARVRCIERLEAA
jgi:16S rRNA (cytosine1402-N4)-methyltransferase